MAETIRYFKFMYFFTFLNCRVGSDWVGFLEQTLGLGRVWVLNIRSDRSGLGLKKKKWVGSGWIVFRKNPGPHNSRSEGCLKWLSGLKNVFFSDLRKNYRG